MATGSIKTIGMVGIGLMGHGIASNLLKHGYELMLFEHPGNQPIDGLTAAGATTSRSLRELAAASDAVILVLTGAPQVETVLTQTDGILAGLRAGGVVIDCSTSLPETSERMAAAVQAAGGRFLDSPMTRTPKEAAEGRLNLLVGGEPALLEACRPLLKCFAEHITHTGPVGAGHSMKLLHNYVSMGMVALLSEAAVCAAHSGVGPQTFVDVLAAGGAGGTALERVRPYLVANDPSGLRFSIANARKDLDYYNSMARGAAAPQGIAGAVLATLTQALQLRADGLMPELASILDSRSSP